MIQKRIPVNLITGFLGTGKTTAIINLLAQQQTGEKWAVVVNEFGEVGIDGALIQGSTAQSPQLVVKEVAGGCICCSVGMTMQVTLTRLLREVKPDRILIEPTGVAHPAGILDVLQNQWLVPFLEIKTMLCLIDPQQFSLDLVERSLVYCDQVLQADVIVLNKCDLANSEQIEAVLQFLATLPIKQLITQTTYGKLELAWLNFSHIKREIAVIPVEHQHIHTSASNTVQWLSAETAAAPIMEIQRFPQTGLGRSSFGWIFPESYQFSEEKLFNFFNQLNQFAIERAKGIFKTEKDEWQAFNRATGKLEMRLMNFQTESRIELIAEENKQVDWIDLEKRLLATIISTVPLS